MGGLDGRERVLNVGNGVTTFIETLPCLDLVFTETYILLGLLLSPWLGGGCHGGRIPRSLREYTAHWALH